MSTRRQFLQVGGAVAGGALLRWQSNPGSGSLFQVARALAATDQTPLAGKTIPQFVTPLPTFNTHRVSSASFQVQMREFQQKVLPDQFYASLAQPFSAGTFVFGYQVGSQPASYPAATIVGQRGTPTTVKYVNAIPSRTNLSKTLRVDQSLHWADPLDNGNNSNGHGSTNGYGRYEGPQPGVPHLHGAEVPSAFDGVPDAWFTPDGRHGPAYRSLAPTDANAAIYRYPNSQPASTLWWHDHTLGMTRINVLSGLAGMYLLRDQYDTGLANNPLGLPAGDQEVELVLQDRQFDTNGQWYFPDSTSLGAGLNGDPPNPRIHKDWIPEFFGDVIVVNGRSWPYLDVEPRRYRFRVVNGSNARFYRMWLADSTTDATGPTIWQIGTDGGLLDRPVKPTDHEDPQRHALFLAPGERADIIVDFRNLAGKTFTLRNDAQYPFPSGGPVTPGLDDRVMQFRVSRRLSSRDTSFDPATGASLRGAAGQDRSITPLVNRNAGTLGNGVKVDLTRQLVLVEVEGPGGPVEVLLNNTRWDGLRSGTDQRAGGPGSSITDGVGNVVTEAPRVGSTEVWEIMNLTQDAHPIHLHLIQFQLMNRQAIASSPDPSDPDSTVYEYRATYDASFPGGKYEGLHAGATDADATWGRVDYAPGSFIPAYGPPLTYAAPNADGAVGGNPAFSPFLVGPTVLPEPGETGWKDTIKAYPGTVTRIVTRWTPQDTAVGASRSGQNLFPFDPASGPGYVWHCHILDHEDNEMMRPLRIA